LSGDDHKKTPLHPTEVSLELPTLEWIFLQLHELSEWLLNNCVDEGELMKSLFEIFKNMIRIPRVPIVFKFIEFYVGKNLFTKLHKTRYSALENESV
jgi:hypothetical protein